MTNYTTKRQQTLTRKMWGLVVYRNIADIFSYIAHWEIRGKIVANFP